MSREPGFERQALTAAVNAAELSSLSVLMPKSAAYTGVRASARGREI